MGVIVALLPLAVTAFVIVYVVRSVMRLRRHISLADDPHWQMHAFVSLDDIIGQLLIGVGVTLGVVALVLASRRLGLPIAADYYLLLGTVAAFLLAWHFRAPALYVLAALASYGWWSSASWRWVNQAGAGGVAVPVGLALVGLALMAAGRLLEASGRGARFGFFSWLFGLLGLLGFLAWASSQDGIAALGHAKIGSPFVASVPLAILTGAAFAVSLALLIGAHVRVTTAVWELDALAIVWLAVLALAAFPPRVTTLGDSGPSTQLTAPGMIWAVVFNVFLLAILLGLVFLGYARRENWLVNLGAALLFVFVLLKYFDWLFTFLDRSIAFIVAGLLFLGVGAAMERGRRYVIAAMEPADESS